MSHTYRPVLRAERHVTDIQASAESWSRPQFQAMLGTGQPPYLIMSSESSGGITVSIRNWCPERQQSDCRSRPAVNNGQPPLATRWPARRGSGHNGGRARPGRVAAARKLGQSARAAAQLTEEAQRVRRTAARGAAH